MALANDVPRLQEIRQTVRTIMKKSSDPSTLGILMIGYLCNGAEFTKNLEATYRDIWGRYCDSAPSFQDEDSDGKFPE